MTTYTPIKTEPGLSPADAPDFYGDPKDCDESDPELICWDCYNIECEKRV
jgi:hypothetical protein